MDGGAEEMSKLVFQMFALKPRRVSFLAFGDSKYSAEKFVKFGGPQDADQPESRLPSTLDIWKPIIEEDLA
ncbi:hypothetical protein DKX38_007207 [Salix brachista]|uniref:Uncharacterized protein n=1 Tax=Salix brachista TaxID=2182728 RepID=A0A5N5MMZ1_9ROSI|nr:hypothetical protein DKX38_007207 [Salix brachista]